MHVPLRGFEVGVSHPLLQRPHRDTRRHTCPECVPQIVERDRLLLLAQVVESGVHEGGIEGVLRPLVVQGGRPSPHKHQVVGAGEIGVRVRRAPWLRGRSARGPSARHPVGVDFVGADRGERGVLSEERDQPGACPPFVERLRSPAAITRRSWCSLPATAFAVPGRARRRATATASCSPLRSRGS